ncbi:MAG: hypothetical protein HY903_22725 [Deltaproteobacteria bacterium]|nr:hypothetical protein [Deltaproteobacteria bacterium]
MTTRLLLTALAVGGVCGCGDSYIVLEIAADLKIPDDADQLQVTTMDAADVTQILADQTFTLESGQRFPIEVLLEPSDATPRELRESVVASKAGLPVASNEVEHSWTAGHTSRARFALGPIP